MEEKKIWYNKKILGGILGLLGLSVLFFFYQAEHKSLQQDWTGVSYADKYLRSEREHIASFHEDVKDTLRQASSMDTISIFAQEDSFSTKNLDKTKQDFIKLLEIQPQLIENMSLQEFFAVGSVHVFALAAIGLVAYALLDEDKQGLRAMIFATSNGRDRVVFNKIAALFYWSGVLVLAFYGAQFLTSTWYYKGNILKYWDVPLQSLSMFREIPLRLQMGEFLILYGVIRWLVLFLFAICIWGTLFWVNHILIGVGMLGAIGLISAVVFFLIDENHTWNILRVCNPWYWILGNNFFIEYRNLNIFSEAINKNTVVSVWVIGTILLITGISLFIGVKRYPCEPVRNKWMLWGIEVLQRCKNWKASWMAGLGLTGMEYYKLLISQKGILIVLVVVLIFACQTDFSKIHFSTDQEMYFSFVEKYKGVPNEASEIELAQMRVILDEVEKDYQEKQKQYEEGGISANDWMAVCIMYDAYHSERTFLSLIDGQTEYLGKLKEEKGIAGWYVNLYGYNKLLSEESIYIKVVLYVAVTLLSVGLVSVENKNGMLPLIRGSEYGEKACFIKKMQVVWTISILLYMLLAGLELIMVESLYGLDSWRAPVQSILALSEIPIPCSIGTYFTTLFLARGAGILALSSVSCWISKNRKRG